MIHEKVFEQTDRQNPAELFSQWLEEHRDAELVRVSVSYRVKIDMKKAHLDRFLQELEELA